MIRKKTYIEPGFLVAGDIHVDGCTTYRIADRSESRKGRSAEADWKTHKRVEDAEEQRALLTTKQRLSRDIAILGARVTGFGYIVPAARGKELDKTLQKIDAEVAAYNKTARVTRMSADFAVFQIDASDDRVAAALYKRVASVLEQMEAAVERGDVKRLRAAMIDMKGLDTVLPGTESKKISALVKKARTEARAALKSAKKAATAKKAEAAVRKTLRTIPIDTLRAEVVETLGSIQRTTRKSFLPPVDTREID